jgi:hypothetical protein
MRLRGIGVEQDDRLFYEELGLELRQIRWALEHGHQEDDAKAGGKLRLRRSRRGTQDSGAWTGLQVLL